MMNHQLIRRGAVIASAAALLFWAPAAQAGQNQAGATQKKPAAKAAKPAPKPVLSLAPAGVRQVQRALKAAGEKPGNVDGVWGDGTSKALASFQGKKGIDPSGHVDLMTLAALGLTPLLNGELPAAAAGQPLSADAMKSDGVELYVSPAFVRTLQQSLAKKGAVPGNILGVWHAASTAAALKFEKAHGLDASANVNLQLIQALDLDQAFVKPAAPAAVPMLAADQAPFAGAPIYLAASGVKAIQQALKDQGYKDVPVDGTWTADTTRVLEQFQQAQHLSPNGQLNLRTLRALGFEPPIPRLAQAATTKS